MVELEFRFNESILHFLSKKTDGETEQSSGGADDDSRQAVKEELAQVLRTARGLAARLGHPEVDDGTRGRGWGWGEGARGAGTGGRHAR